MKIDYEGQTLQFDLEDITIQQATVLKRQLGMTLLALDKGLIEGDPDALRAVFWLIQSQSGNRVDINEVDFKVVKFANAIQKAVEAEEAEEAEADGKAPKEEQV
jgi:hypothetical protein